MKTSLICTLVQTKLQIVYFLKVERKKIAQSIHLNGCRKITESSPLSGSAGSHIFFEVHKLELGNFVYVITQSSWHFLQVFC